MTNSTQIPEMTVKNLLKSVSDWGVSSHHVDGLKIVLTALSHIAREDKEARNTNALRAITDKTSPWQASERKVVNAILRSAIVGLSFNAKENKFILADQVEFTPAGQKLIEFAFNPSNAKLHGSFRFTVAQINKALEVQSEKTVTDWADIEILETKAKSTGNRLFNDGMTLAQFNVFANKAKEALQAKLDEEASETA